MNELAGQATRTTMWSAEEQVSEHQGVITELGDVPRCAIVFEDALTGNFDRCPASIKRAVGRGQIPEPMRIFGKNAWLVDVLLQHSEALHQEGARDRAERDRKIGTLRSARIGE